MVHNWKLLAALLSLPIISLTALEGATESCFQEATASNEISYKPRFGMGERRADKNCCVVKKRPCEDQIPEEEAIGCVGMITPPVAPQIVCGTDTFVSVDFIWWKTFLDGMEFVYSGVLADPSNPVDAVKGRAYYPDYNFNPGVKIGIGSHIGHDGWDLVAEWTCLVTGTRTKTVNNNSPSTIGFSPIDYIRGETAASTQSLLVEKATSKWKQDFNVIDLALGRDFFLSRYLTMRPHVGFKTAWIHETTTNSFVGIPGSLLTSILGVALSNVKGQIISPALAASNGSGVTPIVIRSYEHMWGIGLRTGFDTGWRINQNWMFYGDLALTNLWGKFKKGSIETATIVLQDYTEHFSKVLPVVELSLGLSYINWFYDNTYRFEMRLGWEEQVWLNYNRSQDFTRVGDLSVQGLTFKTMLNF